MLPGDVIAGRFELERPVAAGGMGRVYRAIDRLDGAPVALKVLLAPADEAAARFRQEVEILAAIRHPGIVRFVSFVDYGTRLPFLVMDFVAGESLERRLRHLDRAHLARSNEAREPAHRHLQELALHGHHPSST